MNMNEYQKHALRFEGGMDKTLPRVLNGALGLSGEVGEFNDLLKKHYYQGHPLDRDHLAKELGDVLWYLALAADTIGYDLETIASMNIHKLEARYPNGFESDKSLNRAAGDV